MAIMAVFDADGRPRGFYLPEVHGDAIPEEAVAITAEQWQELLAHQGWRRWDAEAGGVVPIPGEPAPEPEAG
jgi:hypothetical protein